MNHNIKKKVIWQNAMNIATLVFEFTKTLVDVKRYGFRSQMNRIGFPPSNIAEGSGRNTSVHFAEFLSRSFFTSLELEAQLLICENIHLGDKSLLHSQMNCVQEITK